MPVGAGQLRPLRILEVDMGHEPASRSADIRLEGDLAAVLRTSFAESLRSEPSGAEWIDSGEHSVHLAELCQDLGEAARPEIDSLEQFEALPVFTVLRDSVGVVCELQDTSHDQDGSSSDWFAIGDGYPATVELPALLLYAPVAPDD
jgi:hypothetical protein